SRERAVGHMVPAARSNASRVAQTTLDFIGERDGGDQLASACAYAFRRRQRSRNIIAWMRRFLRKVGVVIIEVANGTAVGECRPIRRRLVIRADDYGSMFRRKIRGNFSRNRARLFFPRAQRAA